MGHTHGKTRGTSNLRLAFFLNLCFTLLEVIGGVFTNSIAILSDALHDLGDSLSLGLAWYLEDRAQKKGATSKFSFGFARLRLLGALLNALVLIGGSACIIIEAIGRFQNPQEVKPLWMTLFAMLGILANGYAAWRTRNASSLNEKSLISVA